MRVARHGEMPCDKCSGTGFVRDPRVEGAEWRERRRRAGKTATEVAQAMGYSKMYISYLELGKRAWNEQLRDAYREAL